MNRILRLAVLAVPLMAGLLGGCTVVYEDGHRPPPHYWYWR
jgi:hypothetical protein